MRFPLSGHARDLHPLDYAHVGRTDKNLDLKVRTDILVMSEFWDNDIPGYGKTRKLSSADKKKVNTLVTDIITKLTDEYDAETADAVWVREVVNHCMFPEVEQKRSTPTFIDRFEQYLNEHKMAENSYNIYPNSG